MLQCLIYKQIYRFSRNVSELLSISLINSPPLSLGFLNICHVLTPAPCSLKVLLPCVQIAATVSCV